MSLQMTNFFKNAVILLVNIVIAKAHSSKWMPDALSVNLENFWAMARRKKVRFKFEKGKGLCAREDTRQLRSSNKNRGFSLYRNGIETRERFLFNSYCLQNISFTEDDVVFDCGANSGELFLSLSKLIKPENYYAFEPNPSDFKVLRTNVATESKVFNLGLGNVDAELSFYVYTEGADSSFIEPKNWTEKLTVPVVRLDSFVQENKIEVIKLLKLEAEGFEPEILEGFGDKILCCEYIALDGGHERGKKEEQTLTTCTNYLLSNGFEMFDIYFHACRALYRRK
jgi:FkbM family methyltransferase